MQPWIIVVILGAAAICYALLLPNKRRETAVSSDHVVKEVEATLEQYMTDIESENEQLVDLIGQMKQEAASKQLAQQEQIAELRQRVVQLEQQYIQHDARLGEAESGLRQLPAAALQEAYASIVAAQEEPTHTGITDQPAQGEGGAVQVALSQEPSIKERYPELFELHSQGKSIDVIGKMVGLQRGEVQLILQLAKQEGSL